MKTTYSFIIFLFICSGLFAQQSVKGFKNLEKSEYQKAVETFSKYTSGDSINSVANFGLAVAYSADDNPDHDYFKAWDYFVKASKTMDKLTPDETEYLKQYFTARDPRRRNRTIKYNYDFEEKIIEDKLIKFVREENSLSVADHFIAVYPNSKYYENVIHIRNHILFRNAEKANTLDAYNDFISKYPEAAQIPKAIIARDILAYNLTRKANTLDAYEQFMKSYPKADQYFDAMKMRDQLAFEKAQKMNTIEGFNEFVTKYPKALQVMNARTFIRELMYKKAKEVNTLEAYNDFISKYPDGSYFVDIFNLKSNVLGDNIRKTISGAEGNLSWIKGFDSESQDEQAGGIVMTSDGKIIIGATRTKPVDIGTEAWLICVDNSGKVLWNKAFGKQVYNQVNTMTLTPQGDILLAGWSGAVTDSVSRKSWIFKVSATGSGLWERNIEGNEIKDVNVLPDGNMYLSGYLINDSLETHLFFTKLNSETHKLWSRVYTRQGTIEGFATNANSEIISGAGRWVWKMDKDGYILWEKILPEGDSIYSVRNLNNQFVLCGLSNGKPLVKKMTDAGVIQQSIVLESPDTAMVVTALPLQNNRFITAETLPDSVVLRYIDEKGNPLKSITIQSTFLKVSTPMVVSANAEVFFTFTSYSPMGQGDIGLIKLNL